jgi:SAM-dependent methyltransferase
MTTGSSKRLTSADLEWLSARTLGHYDTSAESFERGTRDHDVSQNYAAFLSAIKDQPPLVVLDLGCGPGRDLAYFRSLGHEAVGLDGSIRFVQMARAATGCEVLHQNFLSLALPDARFHGIFANASLFHVPTQELSRVLGALRRSLRSGGVLFCSNPRGSDTEGFSGDRYGAFHTLETWRAHVSGAGFTEIEHYYRPTGLPRDQQPWVATVWRRAGDDERGGSPLRPRVQAEKWNRGRWGRRRTGAGPRDPGHRRRIRRCSLRRPGEARSRSG